MNTATEVNPAMTGSDRWRGCGWMNTLRRFKTASGLIKQRVKEALEFDSRVFSTATGVVGLTAGLGLCAAGRPRQGFNILSKLHRFAGLDWISRPAERLARAAADPACPHPLGDVYRAHVEGQVPTPASKKFFEDPGRLLGALALVLKSPKPNERGVIVINYSYLFPLFAKLFDIENIAGRYFIVLEPSWSGYCNLDVLCYSRYPFPVFVQAYEPRDADFIRSTQSNLIVVGTSTNWWVDHRLFVPRPNAVKDIDVVMIASWAKFKRHHRFFSALRSLRRAGTKLRVALLGYPVDLTRADITRLAEYYGIADQLEIREWATPAEVGEYLSRAKVNVIWSRREGVNRAIIEGMFAGVPCIVRDGFNYGYCYPYINAQTGCFSTESELPEQLRRMVERHREFAPREWVMEHMSCQKATQILNEVIRGKALDLGEKWTEDLAVKVNRLNDMGYWDVADTARFREDYAYLRSMIRSN